MRPLLKSSSRPAAARGKAWLLERYALVPSAFLLVAGAAMLLLQLNAAQLRASGGGAAVAANVQLAMQGRASPVMGRSWWWVAEDARSDRGSSRSSSSSSTTASGSDEAALREAFWRDGAVGPFTLEPSAVQHWSAPDGSLARIIAGNEQLERARAGRMRADKRPLSWASYYRELSQPAFAKTAWAAQPELAALAMSPQILRLLRALVGPDVMLWGTNVISRGAGAAHSWHTDVEVAQCRQSASVWVAAANVSADAAIQVVSGSHDMAHEPLLAVNSFNGSCMPLQDGPAAEYAACLADMRAIFDADGAALAKRVAAGTGRPSRAVRFDGMRDGDFAVFQGQAWHGTPPAAARTRWTIVLHYAAPSCLLRQPFWFDRPTTSAFPQAMALSLMVLGEATPEQRAMNNIVDGPLFRGVLPIESSLHLAQGFEGPAPRALSSESPPWVGSWLTAPEAAGVLVRRRTIPGTWEQRVPARPFSTELLEVLWASYTTHAFGVQPSPLQQHAATEEVLLLLNGTAAVERAGPGAQWPVKYVIDAGTAVFHPISEPHTIACLDRAGCAWVSIKWRPRAQPPRLWTPVGALGDTLPGSIWRTHTAEGRSALLEEAELTSGLFVRLRVEQLAPRERVAERRQPFDSLAMVMTGSVTVGPSGRGLAAWEPLITPAGAPVSLEAGRDGARLVVLELHPRELPAHLANHSYGHALPLPALYEAPGLPQCREPSLLPVPPLPPLSEALPHTNDGDDDEEANNEKIYRSALNLHVPVLRWQGSWTAGAAASDRRQQQQEEDVQERALAPGLTVASHGDWSRLPVLRQLCRVFSGPVSFALQVSTHNGRVVLGRTAERATTPGLAAGDGGGDDDAAAVLAAPRDGQDLFTLLADMPNVMRALAGADARCSLTLQLHTVALAAPEERLLMYAVNALRNAALAAVTTEFVTVLDGDLLPSATLSAWHADPAPLRALMQQPPPPVPASCGVGVAKRVARTPSKHAQHNSERGASAPPRRPVVLVLPALELACPQADDAAGAAAAAAALAECERRAERLTLGSKADVVAAMAAGELSGFRAEEYAPAYMPTDYERWASVVAGNGTRDARGAYSVAFEYHFEPYTILRTAEAPWFDEAFFAHYQNKAVYVWRLHLMGAQLVVAPDAWAIHVPHTTVNKFAFTDGPAALSDGMEALAMRGWLLSQRMPRQVRAWREGGDARALAVSSRFGCGGALLGPRLNADNVGAVWPGCEDGGRR